MTVQPDTSTPLPSPSLIVELDHVELVTAKLDELCVHLSPPESNEELGLALLADLAEGTRDGYRPLTDLDALLGELRRQFSAKYGGWVPMMEGNPHVEAVSGVAASLGTSKPLLHSLAGRISTESSVLLGVIDTALYPHPSFGPLVHANPPFVPAAGPVPPHAGHSTFVTSLILAQAPTATIDVRGVLDSTTGLVRLWEAAKAMMSLDAAGVDILTLPFGCFTAAGEPPLVLRRAIDRLNSEVVVVAAAGNHAGTVGWRNGHTSSSPIWPAALPTVIAVGATDQDGKPASFSPKQPWVTCTARGVDVEGAYLNHEVLVHDESGALVAKLFEGDATWSGTSFAAATVSGRIAAQTVPGKVTARQALDELLAGDPEGIVTKYHHPS